MDNFDVNMKETLNKESQGNTEDIGAEGVNPQPINISIPEVASIKSNKVKINPFRILVYIAIISAIIFLISFSLLICSFLYKEYITNDFFKGKTLSNSESIFDDTYRLIEEANGIQTFLDNNDMFGLRKELSEDDVINLYLLSRYDDDYLVYEGPSEEDKRETELFGIGISVVESGRYCKVKEITPNGPAAKAGLKVDDILVRLNDVTFSREPVKEFKEALGAIKKDATFYITYYRDGLYNTVSMKKEHLEIPKVYHSLLDNKIPYIRLTTFSSYNVGEQFYSTVKEMNKEIASTGTLVIDLRDNGGGHASEAMELLGYFIGNGKVGLIIDTKQSGQVKYKTSTDKIIPDGTEIYILTNYGTASASELMIISLKDYGLNVKVLGERTFGKGIAQDIVNVPWGGTLRYTQGLYYSAFGTNIHEIGIEPDITAFGEAEQNEKLCDILGIEYNSEDFTS